MSSVLSTDRPSTGSSPGPIRPKPGADDGRPSLLMHHVALGVVLAAVLPMAGTGGVWSADEGALLYQATAVIEGRGWTFPHPFLSADPSGVWFPVHLSSFAAEGGFLVLGKHTPFVVLAGLLHQLGGYPAVLALSTISALAAASATARLAGRLDRRAAVPALWLAGVASPLFLSAYVAWGHTLAAALVGWAVVGLTAIGRRRLLAELAGAAGLGLACLVRTEATLAAIALTLALAAAHWRPKATAGNADRRRTDPTAEVDRGAGTGRGLPWRLMPPRPVLLAGVATLVGFGLDRATAIGRLGPVRAPGDRWGGVPGRLEGFAHTWLRPDFSSQPEHLLFLVAAAAVIASAVLGRRRRPDAPPVLAGLALAAAAVLLRFALSPVALIPGLVVAFPVLFAGLALLRGEDLRRRPAGLLAVFVSLFWGAVLATQYRYGGGGEWGGRYFALGLPAAIPLATVGLMRAVEPLTGAARRLVAGLAGIVILLPVAMGILGLRDARVRTAAITDRVEASLLEAGDGGPPVVVTTLAPLGRWAWEDLDRGRWLLVTEDELPEVGARLRDLGIERLVFVTDETDAELERLAEWYVTVGPLAEGPGATLDRVVLRLEASTG